MTRATEIDAEINTGSYELMFILHPDLRESDVQKKLKEMEESIAKAGGKITQQDFWGSRKLAYRIKGQSEGAYMIYNMVIPTSFVKELRESLRIDKDVLRSLILALPEGHVYTKYDMTIVDEPRKRKEPPRRYSHPNISIKHSGGNAPAKIPAEDKEKGKEANAADLDKKLDQIIGGSDLKL